MTRADTDGGPARWLLLLHQLPAKPAYQRVKIWRRLQGLGAVAIKKPSMRCRRTSSRRRISSGC